MTRQKSKSKKLSRRDMIREVAVEFRNSLPPQAPAPRMVTRGSRRSVPHYELAQQAINEFIDVVGQALSDNRGVTLRGFGRLVPKQYKPMKVRLPGAGIDDDEAVVSVPVRFGIQFRPSPKLKQAIREHDEKNSRNG